MAENLDNTPDVQKAQEIAATATQPDTFDFAATVLGRSYPQIDVAVYLDERNIQKMLETDKERKLLELRIANNPKPSIEQAEQLEYLDLEYQEAVDALRSQRYTVTIKGISPEKSIELEKDAFEKFPREYEESTHALTNAVVRTEKHSDERDEYFAALLRQAHIVSVTAPNGAKDTSFTDIEKVKATWARLPFIARAKVDQAINEATIAVDFYDELVDEVF